MRIPAEAEDRILCGRCKTPVEIEAVRPIEEIVRCPVCGETDSIEAARREASQHTAYRLLRRALGPLNAGAPEVRYRFHAG
jgi:hypothetical protein